MEATISEMDVRSWKRFSAYKKTSAPYLSEMPSHWQYCPVWTLFNLGRGRVISQEEIFANQGQYPVYSSQTLNDGVLGFMDTFDFDGEYLTWTTDGAHAGTVFHRSGKFSCTNVCGTLAVVKPNVSFAPYYAYALNTITKSFVRHDINPKLMNNVMAGIRVYLPPLPEQRAIAAFLDRETARIDALIGHKQRLIQLLEEKRQAVISHAVTKGLDPNVEMKESGVEWLGHIPSHWVIRKVSHLFKASKGTRGQELTKEYCAQNSGPYPVYSGQTENDGIMGMLDDYEFDFGKSGVLFSTTVGAKAMHIKLLKGRFSLSQNCMIIRTTTPNVLIEFYEYHFFPLFRHERNMIPEHMQASFRMDDLYEFRVAVPTVAEQNEIANYIKKQNEHAERVIEAITQGIKRLREYRSALISAAVTGQIDVRDEVQLDG